MCEPPRWCIILSALPHPVCESASLDQDEITLKEDLKGIRVLGMDREEGETLLTTLSIYAKTIWHSQLCKGPTCALYISVHGICMIIDAKSLPDQNLEHTPGYTKIMKCHMNGDSEGSSPQLEKWCILFSQPTFFKHLKKKKFLALQNPTIILICVFGI